MSETTSVTGTGGGAGAAGPGGAGATGPGGAGAAGPGGGGGSSTAQGTGGAASSSGGGGGANPCEGVLCDMPPPDECDGADLKVYATAGTCDGGACTYGSTSTICPNGCVNGQCVACTVDAQCGPGKWCSGNQCQTCSSDLHCGASCVACGGATPYCDGASCVECLTAAECDAGEACDAAGACVPVAGCTPPATACTSGGSQDGGCANAYRISRNDAGTPSGFTVNNTYGLCNRANNFTTGNCGGNTGSDAEYRLFMRQGETADVTLTRGTATCSAGWAGTISLKIYEAACSPDCTTCPQTCSTIDYCVQSNNQNTGFVAPSDGWYTIVVDSQGPVDDKGGVFYLNVKLACAGGSCACQ